MRVNLDMSVDIVKLALKRDKDEARVVVPTVAFAVDSQEAVELFGEAFAELAFGALRSTGSWGFEKMVPDVVFEKHALQIGKHLVHTMPKFDRVEPIDDTHSLLVRLRLPYEYRRAALVVPWVESFGDGITIVLQPLNEDLEDLANGAKRDPLPGVH